MTRVLWFGDVADTGFGTVTWNVGRRLIEQGVDVRFLSQNQTSDPVPAPMGERTWDASKVTVPEFMQIVTAGFRDGWKADCMAILGDYYAAAGFVMRNRQIAEAFRMTPTFHYIPVEGVGLPPTWGDLWKIVMPVAMSRFGQEQVAEVIGHKPPLIYHGVSTDDFYPVSTIRPGFARGQRITSKAQAKALFGYPEDRIMVLRTDRHMPRKQQNRLIRAMVPVLEANPQVDLVLHCAPNDQGGRLSDTIAKLPAHLQDRVLLTKAHDTFSGLVKAELNVLYNAADIYASVSAEGFGLTIAEAIACGVPAVALDYSAVPEVVGPAGVTVPYAHLVDNEYDHMWASVDEEKFAAAVTRLVNRPAERRQLGSLGPRHVARMFDWDEKASQFAELFAAAVPQEVAA
jgi:glycosyltransferase involved in cell wall biosynthesis